MIERGFANEALLQHQQMLAHGLACPCRIASRDCLNDVLMLRISQSDCSAGTRSLTDLLPGLILPNMVHHIENSQEELVSCALGDLAMKGTIPELASIRIFAFMNFLRQFPHTYQFGRPGAHRSQLRQLRFNSQPNFHDFHEICTCNNCADISRPVARPLTDEGSRTLTAPNLAFRFKHFQSPTYCAATHAQSLREVSLCWQLAVCCKLSLAQKLSQLLKRIVRIIRWWKCLDHW